MASVARCITKLGDKISADDIARVREIASEYEGKGYTRAEAEADAVSDALTESRTHRASVAEQITQAGGVAPTRGQASRKDGQDSQEFFSKVTKGETGVSAGTYTPEISTLKDDISKPDSDAGKYHAEYETHKGKFDDHIALSIPGYRDFQYTIGDALIKTFDSGSMLDVGASEGTQAKTITSLSNGQITSVSMDPNQDMRATFDATSQVEGAEYSMTALGTKPGDTGVAWDKDGVDINYFDAKGQKFDIVQESMVFQFINDERAEHIARLAELVTEDGIVIIQEKVKTDQWDANEKMKNEQFKSRYFSPEDMDAKSAEVLEGMNQNMVSQEELVAILNDNFTHVEQIWDSGNFKGYAASNSADTMKSFTSNMGDTRTQFDTRPESQDERQQKIDGQGWDTDTVWYHVNRGGIVGENFDDSRLPANDPDAPFNAHWLTTKPSPQSAYRGGQDGDTYTPVYLKRGGRASYRDVQEATQEVRNRPVTAEGFGGTAVREELKRRGFTHTIWRGRDAIDGDALARDGRTKFKTSRGASIELVWDKIRVRGEEYDSLEMYENGEHITGYSDLADFENSYPEQEAVAVFDPSIIRSVNAAFDPGRVDDSDIMASRTPEKTEDAPLFSKGSRIPSGATPRGITVEAAQKGVDEFMHAYSGASDGIKIRVVATQKEAWGGKVKEKTKAGYSTKSNTLTVVAGNIENMKDMRETMQHEIFVHKGLGFMSTKDIDALFAEIERSAPESKTLQKDWAAVQKLYADKTKKVRTEEFLARIAETKISPMDKAWTRIITKIRDILRKMGWVKEVSRSDLRSIVYNMADAFAEGREANARTGLGLLSQKGKSLNLSQAARKERAREQGFDVDTVWYHGTGVDANISAFELGREGSNSTLFGSESVRRAVIFVAEDRGLAEEFSEQGERQGQVIELYVRAEKTFDASGYGFSDLPEAFFEKHGLSQRHFYNLQPWEAWEVFDLAEGEQTNPFVEALKEEGYDSVRLMDVSSGDVENTTSLAVFDPSNIRSVNATFDPASTEDSDILASRSKVTAADAQAMVEQANPEITSPLSNAKAVEVLKKKLNRGKGVGAPKNKRITAIVNGKPEALVGVPTPQQWINRVERILTQEEIDASRTWYHGIIDTFAQEFGQENADKMATAWLLSNQNIDPSGALGNALRVMEQVETGVEGKRGGLAHDLVQVLFEGGVPAKGIGPKLHDFVDSALGKDTRTWMGNAPEGGSPAVVDIHSARDMGYLDPAHLKRLIEKFGEKKMAGVELDFDGGPTETQYEFAAEELRKITKALNKMEWLEGELTPLEVQAIGWTAIAKEYGSQAFNAEESIERNTRQISFELDFGEGSAFSVEFPAFSDLPYDQKMSVTKEIMDGILDTALDIVHPAKAFSFYGPGKYEQYDPQPSGQQRVTSSREAAEDIANIVGYLAQQTEMYISRPMKSGTKLAADILGVPHDQALEFWEKLGEISPQSVNTGFMPIVVDGVEGIRSLRSQAGMREKAFIQGEMTRSVTAVEKEMGLVINIDEAPIELIVKGNDWTQDGEGNGYLQGITERYGSEVSGRLRDIERTRVEEKIRDALGEDSQIAGIDKERAKVGDGFITRRQFIQDTAVAMAGAAMPGGVLSVVGTKSEPSMVRSSDGYRFIKGADGLYREFGDDTLDPETGTTLSQMLEWDPEYWFEGASGETRYVDPAAALEEIKTMGGLVTSNGKLNWHGAMDQLTQADIDEAIQETAASNVQHREWLKEIHAEMEAIKASGLDMSYSARMARAKEMGFDISRILYHGSPNSSIRKFRLGPHDETAIDSVSLSDDPRYAGDYALGGYGRHGGAMQWLEDNKLADWVGEDPEVSPTTYPVYIRGKTMDFMEATDLYESKTGKEFFDASPEEFAAAMKAEGVSGVEMFGDEVAMLDPSSIRSVNAAFDPDASEDTDILASRAEGFVPPEETITDTFIRKLQDKFKPLKMTQEALREADGEITEDSDAYLAEEAFHGKTENDLRLLKEGYIEPLADFMAEHDVSREELDLYLIALHAKERNRHIASIREDMPDGGSGMMNAEADMVLSAFETEGRTEVMDDAAEHIFALLSHQRELFRQGLQDHEITDTWETVYENYVPLKGFAENEDRPRIGRGFDIRGKESMRAMGRRTMAESPVLHAIKDTTEATIRMRKNEVGNAFLELVEDNPQPGYWDIYTDENPDTHTTIVKTAQGEEVRETPVPMAMMKDKYFATKRDGKTYYIKLADKRLMNAMQNLGPESMNVVMQKVGSFVRFLSSMSTSYNPEFMVSNMSRDVQTAIYNLMAEQDLPGGKAAGVSIAKDMVKSIPMAIRAIHATLRKKDLSGASAEWQAVFEQFREDGAKTGWFDMKEIDGQADELQRMIEVARGGAKGKALHAVDFIAEMVDNANTAIENGVRLSVYKHGIDAGLTRKQAASLAKNLTVNFNRKGELGQVLNTMYMFANASIQGTANFARAIGTMKRNDDGSKSLNVAQKAAAGMVGAAFMLSMLNREMAGDDDDGENWYDKVPQYVRERNVVIMKSIFGGEEGKYYTVPLPYGYNVFYNLGDSMEQQINSNYRSESELAMNLTAAFLGSFSPIGFESSKEAHIAAIKTATPTVLNPFVQLAVNENFFGGPIYKENFPFGTPKPDSQLVRRSTKAHWKAISDFLNDATGGTAYRSGFVDINPDTIGHLSDFVTGSAGAFYSRAAGAIEKSVSGEELEDREIPFLRRLQGEVMPYNDQTKYYERRDNVAQLKAEYKSLPGEERSQFLKDHPELKMTPLFKSSEKRLKKLRAARKKIEESKLPDEVMKQRLEVIAQKTEDTINKVNKRHHDIMGE